MRPPIVRAVAMSLVVNAVMIGALRADEAVIASGVQGSLSEGSARAVAALAAAAGLNVRTQVFDQPQVPIEAGMADFGFANAVEAGLAVAGNAAASSSSGELRQIGTLFSLTTGLMAPCDLGLRDIEDLAERASELRLASGYEDSPLSMSFVEAGLATGGLAPADFTRVPVQSFMAGVRALAVGEADLALVSLDGGASRQAALALKDRGGVCYVSISSAPAALNAFEARLSGARIVAFEQDERVVGLSERAANLISVPWLMLTHAGVAEDLVYRMTKALAEGAGQLADVFEPFAGMDRATMAVSGPVPYHPGSMRYFKEAGLLDEN